MRSKGRLSGWFLCAIGSCLLFLPSPLCAYGAEVTAQLESTEVFVLPEAAGYPDFNGDGIVTEEDLLHFLEFWHQSVFLDRDGQVEVVPTVIGGPTETLTPTPTPVLEAIEAIAIHDATLAGENYGGCISCHGKRFNEIAPFVGSATEPVYSAHSVMLRYLPGSESSVTDDTCKSCHTTVDLLGKGGGEALRKRVAVDEPGLFGLSCSTAGCHGVDSDLPFYLINK